MTSNLSGLSAQEIEELKGALEAELKVRGPSFDRRIEPDAPELQDAIATIERCAAALNRNEVEVVAACIKAMSLGFTLRRTPKPKNGKAEEQT